MDLIRTLPLKGRVEMDIPMKELTTLRVGGKADCVVFAVSESDVEQLALFCADRDVPLTVVGRGSNLLVRDGGLSGVVLLMGDLASGKTTLVRALARFRGSKDAVNSPTFSLLQSYESAEGAIYHYDIYNVGFVGLLQRGLGENLSEQGLHLIEWGDENTELYLQKMGLKCVKIEISNHQNKRKYRLYE